MSNLTIHLTVLLFWPLALALLGATGPRSWAPGAAIVGAVVPFAYAVMMLFDYDSAAGGLQYVTNDEWIKALGIRYYLGVDGLNLWLIALTTLLFLVAAMWLSFRPVERPRLFTFHLALAETAVLGAFTAQDLALFVLFFDLMLVPFYFLVGQWGSGPDRVAATYKMIIYTLVGSLLMLAGAVATAVLSADGGHDHVHDLATWRRRTSAASTQRWIFTALRARVPDQDAALPVPRVDAGRVPDDAAAGAGDLLRRALEGGRLRLPADRAAGLPGGVEGLPVADPDPRAAVDHLRLGAGVHADQRAARARLLVDRAARLHRARHLRAGPGGAGRAGRAAADGQPRARRGAAVPDHRAAGRAVGDRGHHERWAGSRSARRCWPRCS